MSLSMSAPFVSYVTLNPDAPLEESRFPGSLSFTKNLHLDFDSPVTFFVGENGSGKSTLLEAMAVLSALPIAGGGTNEVDSSHGLKEQSLLADSLRMAFAKRPKDGYFFRAELQAHFASLLDRRRRDPDFGGDPYARYGGQSLHTQSHGEAFLAILKNRLTEGLFLLDEPESALSPQRQLALLALIYERTQHGRSQFVIATHSPILLTYPSAQIVSFDGEALEQVTIEDTAHYQITKGILNSPESYWKHLRQLDE
ncbi:MAG: AAA family ATPase [Planctomycetaceae bacterium]|nr:AAA family ATPase [Planctomycetaceae bacterium]